MPILIFIKLFPKSKPVILNERENSQIHFWVVNSPFYGKLWGFTHPTFPKIGLSSQSVISYQHLIANNLTDFFSEFCAAKEVRKLT